MEDRGAGDHVPNAGFEAVVAELQSRLDRLRSGGVRPRSLEADLEDHFRRIVAYRQLATPDPVRAVRQALDSLQRIAAVDTAEPEVSSRVPGGAAVHRAVNRLLQRQLDTVRRQMQSTVDEVQAAIDGLTEVCRLLADALSEGSGHDHPQILGQVDAILERTSRYERVEPGAGVATAGLSWRIEQLERIEAARHHSPWYRTPAWEATLDAAIPARGWVRVAAVRRLVKAGPVLDLWAARGELVQLLREQAVACSGVEPDRALVEAARVDGRDVQEGDPVETLSNGDGSEIGGLAVTDVDRAGLSAVAEVVAFAANSLRPGGVVVLGGLLSSGALPEASPAIVFARFLLTEARFSDIEVEAQSGGAAGLQQGWIVSGMR